MPFTAIQTRGDDQDVRIIFLFICEPDGGLGRATHNIDDDEKTFVC